MKVKLNRTVTISECPWLQGYQFSFAEGEVFFTYSGATYGVITPKGTACTKVENTTPFFELPTDALAEVTNPLKRIDWSQISSQVKTTVYNTVTEELQVTFKTNATYSYAKVPPHVYAALAQTQSIGKFINSDIKGKYQYKKL